MAVPAETFSTVPSGAILSSRAETARSAHSRKSSPRNPARIPRIRPAAIAAVPEEPGGGLIATEPLRVSPEGVGQVLADAGAQLLRFLQIQRQSEGEPGIAAAPEDSPEVIHPGKAEPMVQQSRFLVIQILDVHQHLTESLFPPLRPAEDTARLLQEENRHEKRVGPELAFVQDDPVPIADGGGYMLKAAIRRSGKAVHQPLGPLPAEIAERVRFREPVHDLHQRQKGSRGIDIPGGEPLLPVPANPVCKEGHESIVSAGILQLLQTVETYTLGPVPFLNAGVPGNIPGTDRCLQADFPVFAIVRSAQIQQTVLDQLHSRHQFLSLQHKDSLPALCFIFQPDRNRIPE